MRLTASLEAPHPAAEDGDEDRRGIDGLREQVQDRRGPDREGERAVGEQQRDERQREKSCAEGEPAEAVALGDRTAAVPVLDRGGGDEPEHDGEGQQDHEGRLRVGRLDDEERDDDDGPGHDAPFRAPERVVAHEPRDDEEEGERSWHPGGALEPRDEVGTREAGALRGQSGVAEAEGGDPSAGGCEGEEPADGVRSTREDERRDRAVDTGDRDVDDEEPDAFTEPRDGPRRRAPRRARPCPRRSRR